MAIYTIEVQDRSWRFQWGVNVLDGCCVVVCALERIEFVNTKHLRQHRKLVKYRLEKGFPTDFPCLIYTLVKVIGKVSGVEGKDQWGLFYNLSGLEAKGHCFWCGSVEYRGKKLRGRYCSSSHLWAYKRHFNWPFARDWCWIRYASQCGLCGSLTPPGSIYWRRGLEVHHIEPLNAGFRDWTLLNRPENLILLCPPCHDSTRTKDFAGIPKAKVDTNQLILI